MGLHRAIVRLAATMLCLAFVLVSLPVFAAITAQEQEELKKIEEEFSDILLTVTHPATLFGIHSKTRIIYLRVPTAKMGTPETKILKEWIEKGHLCWVDAGAAGIFGFSGYHQNHWCRPNQAFQQPDTHPLLMGVAEIMETWGALTLIPQGAQPVMGSLKYVSCAVMELGDGLVILRPAEEELEKGADYKDTQRFTYNLKRWSHWWVTQRKWPPPPGAVKCPICGHWFVPEAE